MRNVLATHFCEKHVANLQGHNVFDARFAVVHIDFAIQNRKYFFAVVDMPLVRLVSPVKTGCGSAHIGNVIRTPGSIGSEVFTSNNSHRKSLSV
jgi:hypothetical protein